MSVCDFILAYPQMHLLIWEKKKGELSHCWHKDAPFHSFDQRPVLAVILDW